jgi:uncharacterized protein (DUF1697 family)
MTPPPTIDQVMAPLMTTREGAFVGAPSTTPSRFIAFLRAINVGGHTVTMSHLRQLFEALSFASVETFIASGNVIFVAVAPDVTALERQIEDHLRASLGYAVATFIRSTPELAAVSAYQPFLAAELAAAGHALHIAFLAAPPADEAQQRLLAFQTPTDRFHVHGREVYWLRQGRLSDSAFSGALLEKTLGLPATMRNATTITKLAAKYPPP